MNSYYPNQPIFPGEIRKRAFASVRDHFFPLMLVTLVASLPSLVLQLALILSQQNLINAVMMYQYAELSLQVLGRILAAADASMGQTARILWRILPVLYLMIPFLNVGRMYVHLRLLRGAEAGFADVFARARCFLKALLLQVLTIVMVVLWTLPGMAIMFGGAYLLVTGASSGVFTFFYSLGLGVMVFLGVRASLHYTLAPVIMADVPEKGAIACLKESIAMMKKQTMPLLSLLMSFLLFYLLADLLLSLVTTMSNVLGLTISVLVSLFLSAWMSSAVCAYYDQRTAQQPKTFFEEETELN